MLQIAELEELVHKNIKNIATLFAQEQHLQEDFLPFSAQHMKFQQEIEESSSILENTIYDGLNSCIHSLERSQNSPLKQEAVIKELQKCLQSVKNEEDFTQMGLCLFRETSWKKQLGISDSCMQSLYEGARTLFEEKEYSQSEKAFFTICSIDPTQLNYWIGLGHSSFQKQKYQQAICAYSMASTLDPENIWPHIWAANCYEEEYDFDSSKLALSEALTLQKTKTPKNIDLILSLEERIFKIQTK